MDPGRVRRRLLAAAPRGGRCARYNGLGGKSIMEPWIHQISGRHAHQALPPKRRHDWTQNEALSARLQAAGDGHLSEVRGLLEREF